MQLSVCVCVCEAGGVCPAQQQWLVASSARIVNCALQQRRHSVFVLIESLQSALSQPLLAFNTCDMHMNPYMHCAWLPPYLRWHFFPYKKLP